MLRNLFGLLCLFIITGFVPPANAMENLFYILHNDATDRISPPESALQSLTQHAKSLDMLVSQAYQIDQNGMIWGKVDPDVIAAAKQNHFKLLALVTNTQFDTAKAHQFLLNPQAQASAIQALLKACLTQHFAGVQMDFEMIHLKDRDLLTAFYQAVANAFHAKGLIVSYAVAPVVDASPQSSYFLKRVYENWEGAYDLKALSGSADFISVMAYNQHGGKTTPGSTASLPWVEKTIQYTLQYVPAEKISLGIPSYSTYWYTGREPNSNKISEQSAGISYEKLHFLLRQFHTSLQWDEKNHIHYAIFDHDWLNEYLFAEDAQSFADKVALAKKYHLRGISVFDLGSEDPGIWKELP